MARVLNSATETRPAARTAQRSVELHEPSHAVCGRGLTCWRYAHNSIDLQAVGVQQALDLWRHGLFAACDDNGIDTKGTAVCLAVCKGRQRFDLLAQQWLSARADVTTRPAALVPNL